MPKRSIIQLPRIFYPTAETMFRGGRLFRKLCQLRAVGQKPDRSAGILALVEIAPPKASLQFGPAPAIYGRALLDASPLDALGGVKRKIYNL